MKSTDFEISSIAWHEVQDKLDVALFEDVLNDNLQLSKYGTGIQKVFFVFIAVRPENKIHENNVEFDSKEKMISVKLKLSYPHLSNASNQQSQSMMASLFSESINLYSDFEIDYFDSESFRKDVNVLFFAQGFLV